MTRTASIAIVLTIFLAGAAQAAGNDADRVRNAALATYFHGMTDEIALREVGPGGIPVLLQLLADPEFPRRDNVVAFLAHLGGAESAAALTTHLDGAPDGTGTPEDERARLLVPVAMGMIASRGEPGALERLLAWTEPGTADLTGDRALMSLQGLARSGAPEALARLQILSGSGRARQTREQTVSREASYALGVWDEIHRGPSAADPRPSVDSGGDPPVQAAMIGTLDSAPTAHLHGIDHVNHVDLSNAVDDREVDLILWEGSQRAGGGDRAHDVACCLRVYRNRPGGTFGNPGDGLDAVNTLEESTAVLNNNSARVKIVRVINYCGGPGTNIIGCAYTPGDSMMLVPVAGLNNAAILWIHEYGHNLGLEHVDDVTAIMYASNTGNNDVMSQPECDAFHSPVFQAQADSSPDGACADTDDDSLTDTVDNCPLNANENQADSEMDFAGDLCDNCPNNFNPDQADGDGDGDGDVCDDCTDLDDDGYGFPLSSGCPGGTETDCDDDDPLVNPAAMDYCDGRDTDCDGTSDNSTCDSYDADGDGRTDGAELAWIGRAFGQCNSNPSSEWWYPVDYNADTCVDGDDLAVLAVAWGCEGTEPACN